jgi:hypothetical protein
MTRNAATAAIRKEARSDRQRQRRGNYRRPFIGVDGEGGELQGSHEYLLLRAGHHAVESRVGLTFDECAGFIADLDPQPIYVSYYFDYDVTMMIRELPKDRLKRLLNREERMLESGRGVMPIDYHDFQIDYLPHKEFKVRRRLDRGETKKRHYSKWVVISDVGSFFQSSFVAALRKWYGTVVDGCWVPNPGESYMGAIIDKIEEGKQQRNSFGQVTEYEREYNKLEIKALQLLMEKFRAMCERVGLRPGKWQGPGNLVVAQFRRVGMPRNRDISLPARVREIANDGYYGGRFEALQFGEINGPVYQYDINSAYARTYRSLPCLVHGEWEQTAQLPKGGIFVADVSFEHKEGMCLHTLPVRKHTGNIIFPRTGRGTYWSPELLLSRQHGTNLVVHECWVYTQRCDCQHFDWVEDVYDTRREVGKNSGEGMVLKIMLATIYGKMCQSVGSAPYANPIWAGLIVSTVRCQLCSAALDGGNGSDVVMLATDGLFCTQPRQLTVGNQLGEWELDVHEGMFVVQSGVYMLPEKLPKTRGVSQRKVIQHTWDFWECWHRYIRGMDGNLTVTLSLRNFIGIKIAVARNRLDLAGQWVYTPRVIQFDWSTKRTNARVAGTAVLTEAPEGSPDLASVPYSRVIGGTSMARTMDDEQPDWSDTL